MSNKKKEINELVKLYFDFNPHMNRGIAFKAKAHDIIKSYLTKHGKTFDEIKLCIERTPMCQEPIWEQFFQFFFKKNNKKKVENSEYKKSITDSTDVNDWI